MKIVCSEIERVFSLHKIVRFGIKRVFFFIKFKFDKNSVFVHESLDLAPIFRSFVLVPRSFLVF